MRYAIFFENEIDSQIGSILKKEIQRFDIRSSVSLEQYPSRLKGENTDLIIYVGSKLPKSRPSISVPQYFLFQSYKVSNQRKRWLRSSSSLKVIPDFSHDDQQKNGSPIFDLLRTSNSLTTDQKVPYILILTAEKSKKEEISRLKEALRQSFKNHANLTYDVKSVFENTSIVKEASAAIVSCPLGEIIALHFNVSYVRLVRKSFFTKRESSLLNRVANRNLVKEITTKNDQEVKEEIFLLLNDHQHCASLMNEFQKVKEKVSVPIIRSIAQEVVESLEL